jgi:hypothetical protein
VANAQPAPGKPKKSSEDTSSTGAGEGEKKGAAEDSAQEDNGAAPWYKRQLKDPNAPTPPKPPQLKFAPLNLIYDVHSFSGGTGTVTGAGSTLRLSAAIPSTDPIFDGFIGFYFPNGALDGGFSFGHHSRWSFIPALMKSNDVSLYVSAPTFDLNLVGLAGVPFTIGGVLSLIGLKMTSCSTHLTANLAPTAGVWGAPGAPGVALSWGVSLSAGYYFSWEPESPKAQHPEEEKKKEEEEARIKTQRCTL